MGYRKNLVRILSALPLSLAGLGGWITPTAAQAVPAAGAAQPGIVRNAGNAVPVTLTWTLRDEDLFACESAAYDLRGLVRAYGAGVSLHVIAVDSDPALIASFMRRERLDASVVHLSTQAYRQAYRANPIPGIAVSQQGRLVTSVNAGLVHVRDRRGSSSLDEIVGQLLSPSRYSVAH